MDVLSPMDAVAVAAPVAVAVLMIMVQLRRQTRAQLGPTARRILVAVVLVLAVAALLTALDDHPGLATLLGICCAMPLSSLMLSTDRAPVRHGQKRLPSPRLFFALGAAELGLVLTWAWRSSQPESRLSPWIAPLFLATALLHLILGVQAAQRAHGDANEGP